ncbi:MAG: beta-propeller domain-containing protein [Nitrososphaeria archaeon]|nr:beta-propeller domain-containing protein [Nitrososphaeria archaeon]
MWWKRILVIVTAAILVSASTYMLYYKFFVEENESYELKRFGSYNELKNFVKSNVELSSKWFGVYGIQVSPAPRTIFRGIASTTAVAEASPQYSQTNVQVAGVDEPDIVKTDGLYIYYLKGGRDYVSGDRELVIVKAYPPEEMHVMSKIVWSENYVPTGIFVNKNRLIVFLTSYSKSMGVGGSGYYPIKCEIEVYELANIKAPKLVKNVTLEGYYLNARMIEDYVYVVVTSPIYYVGEEIVLPSLSVNGESVSIDPKEVYYTNTPDLSYTFTTIVALNVFLDDEPIVKKTILTGAASNMYVSLNNIYLAITKYNFIKENAIFSYEETLLYRISIRGNSIDFEAEGTVPGHVLNQFSMDEYNGYFRIATTLGYPWIRGGGSSESNSIYVLDMALKVVGKLENLAKGEKIYSARFMGERAYIVTFKKVDPFFVIDLTDARNPKVLGWLKIPGYSDYLHPLGEDHVIGIGKETIEAEEGDFAWYQGLKISLFNVKNVSAPKEISKYVIGERGTDSPILRDHRALLFDSERSFMAIPVLVAMIDRSQYPGTVPPYAYGEPVWQGLYVFNLTIEHGIIFRGKITHLSQNISGGLSSDDYLKFIERAIYIGDYLYTISNKIVKVNDINNLKEVSSIKIG